MILFQKLTDVQLLLAYYLVNIFHKQTRKEDLQQSQGLLNNCIFGAIDDYSCYFEILKMIDLLKRRERKYSDGKFDNKFKFI